MPYTPFQFFNTHTLFTHKKHTTMQGSYTYVAAKTGIKATSKHYDAISREQVIFQIGNLKAAGYRSNSAFNLDGSIEVKMTKGPEYIGGYFHPAE